MADYDVKLNEAGYRAVLRSAGVKAMMQKELDKVCGSANTGARFHSDMAAEPYGKSIYDTQYGCVGHVASRRLGKDGNAVIDYEHKHNNLKKSANSAGWK